VGQNVNYQPRQGGFVSGVAEQTPLDWSVLVNAQVVRGILQPRAGWRLLRRPATYNSVADTSSPDGFSWEKVTDTDMAVDSAFQRGAFLFSAPSGQDWIAQILNEGLGYPTFRVVSSNGELIFTFGLQPTVQPGLFVTPGDPLAVESVNNNYVFVRYYDTVFFTNGGYLWKWEPLRQMQPVPCELFHNPAYPNTGIYFSGYIRGATILAVHQDSLLLSGFGADVVVEADGIIDTDSSGFISEADATKEGGFALAPGQRGVVMTPYTVMVSDPFMPNCFEVSSSTVAQIGSQAPVSALASHMGRLVVWTRGEMWLIAGTVADLSGATILPVSREIGCAGPRAVAQNDDNILCWLTDDGIMAWTGTGAPQKVSDPVQDLFGTGISGFWRWAFTADNPDPQVVGNMPLNSVVTTRDQSSAVWVAQDEYFAFALTSGNGRENNDLVLCWSPSEKQFWVLTAEPATPSWSLGGGPPAYWSQAFPTRRSAAVGHVTLMVSQNEPGMLFSQAESFTNYTSIGAFPKSYLAALATTTDEANNALGGAVTNNRFAAIAVSAPIFLGDSDERLHRRLHLRMMGLRIHDFLLRFQEPADANPLRLYIIPEQGHEDVFTATQTDSTAQTVTPLHPWADAYLNQEASVTGANYFWQGENATDPAYGRWGGTGFATDSTVRRWLPLAPVDKRVDLSSRVSQWFRVALVKIVDGVSDDALRLLSAAVEVVGGYGPRR
jgi:hypothetical protein